MKFVDEFRDENRVRKLADAISRITTRPWTLMEVCGGQTHAIMRFGIDGLLPPSIELLHGPGCPVCVTPGSVIDQAIELSFRPNTILCSYGDMLRVPGNSGRDLNSAKTLGGQVRVLYSPLDALAIARAHPDHEIVFFGVGFETTAPAHAMAILRAEELNIQNFSVLLSHVLVPPALVEILRRPKNRVQGFLAAGHVCSIMGIESYRDISETFKVPIVATGFEPVDILEGVFMLIQQLEGGRYEFENQYVRAVRAEGNLHAQSALEKVFEKCDQDWRGLGEISASGLRVHKQYQHRDARSKLNLVNSTESTPSACQSGLVLTGEIKPSQCPAFGTTCTPDHPLGATMVSSEGACAAYFKYKGHIHA